MSEQENSSYGADQIKVLDGLEAVRKRPSMYIGNTAEEGLHHLIYEVVDNSIDEALAGCCDRIRVILLEDGSCSVEDNGRGIPVDKHPTENMTALELVLTTLHAGGKFDHSSYKVSGGLHGVGVSVVNALSTHVTAEVRRNGKLYRQTFSYGAKTSELEVVGTSEHTGTTITFKPDPEIFTQTIAFKYEIVLNRLRELAFLNRGIHISLKDEQSGAEDLFHYEGGVVEYVEHLNRNRTPIHPQPIFLEGEQEQVQVEVCLQYVDSYTERLASFVNNINTREGGSHVAGFRAALTKCINKYATDDIVPKHMKEKMEGDDVREGLTAIISVRVPNPQFEGQTKTKLGNSEVKGIVASICTEQLGDYLERNPQVARQILSKAVEAARAREAARKARDLSRKKDGISLLMAGKLAECQSKNPAERELFLVEGDSAGGCFSGETKVALADGRALSFLELIAEQEQGKEHFCYTIQADGKIGLEQILHPRLTKRQQEVVQVTLDNGEQIVCTPDHRFLLRDGTYCPAEQLEAGTSLMPLYRKLPGSGCEMIWEPNAGRWRFFADQDESAWQDAEEEALEAAADNHRVVSVEKLTERIDVYDIEVPNTHNFALASGVFVHNSAKQGRDRSIQAILPLRGKIMNVEKARFDKILDSEEIKQLIAAMGTGIGREEFDASKLRYHKIIIMTDADVDGAHIRTLLLTFFYRQMLPLVEQGYVYIGQPPLYRLGRGKKEQYFLNEDALNSHLYDQAAQFVQVRLENGSVLAGQELVSLLKKLTLFERISTFLERMNIQEQLTLFLLENDVHSADQFKEEAFLHGLLDKLASIDAVTSGIRVCATRPSCFEAEAAFQGLAHTRAVIGPHIPLIPEYRHALELHPAIRQFLGSGFTVIKGEEKEIPAKNWRELIRVVREETFKGSHLQRYKGLGEMNPEQLWETTMNPANRTLLRVRIEDAEAADDLFVTLMGDKVEPRREFIQNHALEVSELDV
ncbi:MAG: DNA gyrase subunit B [Candidatus Electronema aureum]|uniref:DNA topoisomerase (ATP-hydrolyzing) n=1 Tax=Candidatus Electronema aureum TaxID=2005002 RepID=A0A521G2R2_9BACT|nr:MAG: DNA gyrase subunit B [Candidatus Electronema aureum]